jgi:hypothetical protein
LCTHDTIQHLKPEKYITENDKKNFYSQWWRLHLS